MDDKKRPTQALVLRIKIKAFPHRESNPGRGGESAES